MRQSGRSGRPFSGGLDISFDLVVKNGLAYTLLGLKTIDIWIKNGKIACLGGSHHAEEKIDASGLLVLPGAVDSHVHFRDPGPNYKEDWFTGSSSAAAGGITTVVDQPNTDPRTLDKRSFEIKLEIASKRSIVDFALNGGAGNIRELVGAGASAIGEIFCYDHSDQNLQKILADAGRHKILPTIHAEDGAVLSESVAPLLEREDPAVYSLARPARAEARAIEKVLGWSNRIHICHLSTGIGCELVSSAKKSKKRVTCEVAPHHLLFNVSDWQKSGTFLKMNPPLRLQSDNDALWAGLRDGTIDILASDHAPHTPEEKKNGIWDAPPGIPGVETMLPLMLFAVRRNLLTLDRLVNAICVKPAKIFGLSSKGRIGPGFDADLVLVDAKCVSRINADRLHSRADWTPYEGFEAIFPKMTIVRGIVVFESATAVRPGFGRFLGVKRVL